MRSTLIIVAFLSLATPALAWSQDLPESPRHLRVATKPLAPFVFMLDSRHEGFSIELWEALAQEIELTYEWVDYTTVGALLRIGPSGDGARRRLPQRGVVGRGPCAGLMGPVEGLCGGHHHCGVHGAHDVARRSLSVRTMASRSPREAPCTKSWAEPCSRYVRTAPMTYCTTSGLVGDLRRHRSKPCFLRCLAPSR